MHSIDNDMAKTTTTTTTTSANMDKMTAATTAAASSAKKKNLPLINWRKQAFETRMKDVLAFQKKHGHANIHYTEGNGLGAWAQRVRAPGGKAKLTQEEVQTLDVIGFVWTTTTTTTTTKKKSHNSSKTKTTTSAKNDKEWIAYKPKQQQTMASKREQLKTRILAQKAPPPKKGPAPSIAKTKKKPTVKEEMEKRWKESVRKKLDEAKELKKQLQEAKKSNKALTRELDKAKKNMETYKTNETANHLVVELRKELNQTKTELEQKALGEEQFKQLKEALQLLKQTGNIQWGPGNSTNRPGAGITNPVNTSDSAGVFEKRIYYTTEDLEIENRAIEWFSYKHRYKTDPDKDSPPTFTDKRKKNDTSLGQWVHGIKRRFRDYLDGKCSCQLAHFERAVAKERTVSVATDEAWDASAAAAQENNVNDDNDNDNDNGNAIAQLAGGAFCLSQDQVDQLVGWGLLELPTGCIMSSGAKAVQNQATLSHLLDPEIKWDSRFQELCAYKERHGNTNPTTLYPGLGRWVSIQRSLRNKKQLREDRVQKLISIDFYFRSPMISGEKKSWEERYEELKQYKEKVGDCRVHQHGGSLGLWVHKQRMAWRALQKRKDYKKPYKGMTEERIQKLEAIGFVFEPRKEKRGSNKDRPFRNAELPRYRQRNSGEMESPAAKRQKRSPLEASSDQVSEESDDDESIASSEDETHTATPQQILANNFAIPHLP